jgi:hypothetical protein
MTDHDHDVDPIPGAPADSLVGLGGDGGFVGQVERELCASTPPPPPTAPEEPEMSTYESITRSYPPIPIPKVRLPEMPLRARMLRPWMGIAGAAVLIALVGMASGDEDESAQASAGEASVAETSEVQTPETDDSGDAIRTRSFGAAVSALGHAAVERGRAELERQKAAEVPTEAEDDRTEAKDNPAEDDEEADESPSDRRVASSDASQSKKRTSKAKGAFNRDAARSAIFGAASRASGCRTRNGPRGRGRATVTISPSGGVSSVSVSGPFAGTKSGRCVASVFRSVRIAPFSGSAVTLSKSFSVR